MCFTLVDSLEVWEFYRKHGGCRFDRHCRIPPSLPTQCSRTFRLDGFAEIISDLGLGLSFRLLLSKSFEEFPMLGVSWFLLNKEGAKATP